MATGTYDGLEWEVDAPDTAVAEQASNAAAMTRGFAGGCAERKLKMLLITFESAMTINIVMFVTEREQEEGRQRDGHSFDQI